MTSRPVAASSSAAKPKAKPKPRPGHGSTVSAAAERAAADPHPETLRRISIWNKTECRKISGNAAPMERNVQQYLSKHPDCELYTEQDLRLDMRAIREQKRAELAGEHLPDASYVNYSAGWPGQGASSAPGLYGQVRVSLFWLPVLLIRRLYRSCRCCRQRAR